MITNAGICYDCTYRDKCITHKNHLYMKMVHCSSFIKKPKLKITTNIITNKGKEEK